MATVFMKWLERKPEDYDRGIQILTLGKLGKLQRAIASRYAGQGDRILDIGCGSGALALLLAKQGAEVVAIDVSPAMLAEAQKKIDAQNLQDQITLKLMDAAMSDEAFPPASFDLIVSTLAFSELPLTDQRYVIEACAKLLASGGHLLIADEVIPNRFLARIIYYVIRGPLALLTWLLTRTSTKGLRGFENVLQEAGFEAQIPISYLSGSLVLYEATPLGETQAIPRTAPPIAGHLEHSPSIRTLLTDLWALFFRIVPPYPKIRPGLYSIGQPGTESPVLVTGNFDLTVRRLVQAIDGQLDAWALVVDSAGINVWCAAGGGYFTADKIIAALKSSRLSEVVTHRALILPQLCANGVDGWKIRNETGWGVHWGPARAEDIPAFLDNGRHKTDSMRWVRFPLKDRLEMTTVTLGFYGLLILLPVLLFWRSLFWPVTASLLGLSYFYAIMLPWLPGRDGLYKSIPLALIALAGLFIFTWAWNPTPTPQLFNWTVGLIGLSVFTAAEMQGMSPLMRGEQANWGWEALVFAILGLTYWLAPMAFGWR